jgi:hypothetical protein
MGTWGTGLLDDDTAMDACHSLDESLSEGMSLDEALEHVFREYEDERPGLRLALAATLLEMGVNAHPLLVEARHIILSGEDLDDWREGRANEADMAERKAVLEEFLARLPSS